MKKTITDCHFESTSFLLERVSSKMLRLELNILRQIEKKLSVIFASWLGYNFASLPQDTLLLVRCLRSPGLHASSEFFLKKHKFWTFSHHFMVLLIEL